MFAGGQRGDTAHGVIAPRAGAPHLPPWKRNWGRKKKTTLVIGCKVLSSTKISLCFYHNITLHHYTENQPVGEKRNLYFSQLNQMLLDCVSSISNQTLFI